MSAISGIPPLRPATIGDPAVARPPVAQSGGTALSPAPAQLAALPGGLAYDTVVAMIARAIASLPPGAARSTFLHRVARIAAQVEAQAAARTPAATASPLVAGIVPDDAVLRSPGEGIARDLAAALADDPVVRSAVMGDPARPLPVPTDVSARDLALAAAAMLGGRVDAPDDDPPVPVRVPADDPLPPPEPVMRDRLYILPATFADPALPGRTFYCRDCVTVDGLLALFPDRAASLDVIRIDYARPRHGVIAAIGAANQNLPVLVLAPGADPALADGEHDGTRFVGDLKRLLHALHVRHGFPEAHP